MKKRKIRVDGVEVSIINERVQYLGLDGNVGDVLGTWAGAVVLSSSFYPISIYGTSHLAPYVGKKRAERKM